MKALVLCLSILLVSSVVKAQGVYNPVLEGAYGGYGWWGPNYQSQRVYFQRQRYWSKYRYRYLNRRNIWHRQYTFEDWDVDVYNAIHNIEVDHATQKFLER